MTNESTKDIDTLYGDQESNAIKELENKIYDEISNGEGDYANLPNFGADYFSLDDAALIVALDEWWLKSLEDEPDFFEGICHPKARSESLPLKKLIVQTLVRAVQSKELNAVVCVRALPNGEPSPERTYAHVVQIKSYLEPYGLGRGHLFEWAHGIDDETFDLSLAISRRRAHIRHGIMPAAYEIPIGQPHVIIQELLKKIETQRLRIIYLENRENIEDDKSFGERKKNNLYKTIGALLHLISPNYKGKQDALIADIEEKFGKQEGLSKRTLEAVFPLAKRLLRSGRPSTATAD